MVAKLINYRAEDGLGAFPDETPRLEYLRRSLALVSEPVPVPKVDGPFVIVLDLSKWQGDIDVDLMWERGIRAVWLKANQGLWVDGRFEQNLKKFIDRGFIVGFYEFIDPEQGCSPEAAARLHWELTRGLDPRRVSSSWLDGERRALLNPSALLDYYVRWYETLSGLCNDDRLIEDYSRQTFWDANVLASPFWQQRGVGLNAARYNLALKSPWSDGRLKFRDWNFPVDQFHLWQYSADGNGLGSYFGCESASVDLNLFSGSWEQFVLYYELKEPIDPGETPPCCIELGNRLDALELRVAKLEDNSPADPVVVFKRVTAFDGLNVRSEPVGGDVLVAMPLGSLFGCYAETYLDSMGRKWVKGEYEESPGSSVVGWAADWWLEINDSGIPEMPNDPVKTVHVINGHKTPAHSYNPNDVDGSGKPQIEINVYDRTGDPGLRRVYPQTWVVYEKAVTASGGEKWYRIAEPINHHGFEQTGLFIKKSDVIMV